MGNPPAIAPCQGDEGSQGRFLARPDTLAGGQAWGGCQRRDHPSSALPGLDPSPRDSPGRKTPGASPCRRCFLLRGSRAGWEAGKLPLPVSLAGVGGCGGSGCFGSQPEALPALAPLPGPGHACRSGQPSGDGDSRSRGLQRDSGARALQGVFAVGDGSIAEKR